VDSSSPLTVEIRRNTGGIGRAGNARRTWAERTGFLVILRDREGARGAGEASPLPGYSPEEEGRARRALEEARVRPPAPLRAGEPPEPQLVEALRAVDPGAPSARFALESALLDLAARRAGVSVARLLAGDRAERTVPAAVLLGATDPDRAAAEARAAAAGGAAAIKMKVGRPGRFDEEAEALRRAGEAAGGAVRLRADANGAWTPEEARERCALLARESPEYLEQPVGPEELLRFRDPPAPIAADESLLLPGAAERLLRMEPPPVLVLKPTLLGGFTPVLRLARAAEAAGAAVTVGHALEGPVALAAAAQLALALPGTVLACGLAPHPGLDAWGAAPPPGVAPSGIRPSGRPGLGVDPPEETR